MKFEIKDLGVLFKKAYQEWARKDPFRQSAVIAYYAVFAIPGLLFLLITFTGYFFDKDAVNQNIVHEVSKTMGADTAAQIKEILSASGQSKSTMLGSIIGFGVLLLGATGVFVELQKALNHIWQVKVSPKKGILEILKARLLSFGLILAIAFLLLTSLVISTILATISNWITLDSAESWIVIFNIFNFIFSLAVISFLFALMFKYLPDAKIKWKHVWLGGLVTGILFTIGKTLLAFYFATANPGSVYGTAGSIILILLWVSYSSMILFFGAELTARYAIMVSGHVSPTEIAVPDPDLYRKSFKKKGKNQHKKKP